MQYLRVGAWLHPLPPARLAQPRHDGKDPSAPKRWWAPLEAPPPSSFGADAIRVTLCCGEGWCCCCHTHWGLWGSPGLRMGTAAGDTIPRGWGPYQHLCRQQFGNDSKAIPDSSQTQHQCYREVLGLQVLFVLREGGIAAGADRMHPAGQFKPSPFNASLCRGAPCKLAPSLLPWEIKIFLDDRSQCGGNTSASAASPRKASLQPAPHS